MLATAGAEALENGIRSFTGTMPADNRPAIDVVRSLGARVELDSQGQDQMVLDLPQQMEAPFGPRNDERPLVRG